MELERLGMLPRQIAWLESMALDRDLLQPILGALSEFETYLQELPGVDKYLPDVDLYERIAYEHMGCEMSLDAITAVIELEIDETLGILTTEAERLAPGQSWQKVVDGLSRPEVTTKAVHDVYRQNIDQLSLHCVDQGLLTLEDAAAWPVKVEIIPDYMRPVRSNAAFSASPGHPPRGGTFYIQAIEDAGVLPVDYRLLTAHETYPGHHLLDSCRWDLERVARRHVEFPIFYEGWASFAEELMFETGFFQGRVDRMLLAKRRFWRAMRGRVDLEIHSRRRTRGSYGRTCV